MGATIGILGGMGPYATLDLFQKILAHTPARNDQEHLRIMIYNNPKIPPRTFHDNPLPELIKSAIILELSGVDFIIMPCHTAHLWYHDIKGAIIIPFYSMVENTVHSLNLQQSYWHTKILLIASQTTINHQLYQKAFSGSLIELVIPSLTEQHVVDATIISIKSAQNLCNNPNVEQLNLILKSYSNKGVTSFIAACTEIPLLFPHLDCDMTMIDPTLMLARMAISKASQF